MRDPVTTFTHARRTVPSTGAARRAASRRGLAAIAALALTVALTGVAPGAGAAEAGAKAFAVVLANGRVANGPETLVFHQGDDVEIRLSSDRPISLHMHGYDIERQVVPGAPAVITLKATVAGRFPVSEHGPGRREHAVVYLEVHP
jgi:hypothetical protein